MNLGSTLFTSVPASSSDVKLGLAHISSLHQGELFFSCFPMPVTVGFHQYPHATVFVALSPMDQEFVP